MKKIAIINGPNLNLLGTREPDVYGNVSFEKYYEELQSIFKNQIELIYYQSNVEGEIINFIHQCLNKSINGIVINPGAYAHTSIAIADAIAAVKVKTIEVHISNIHAREDYRQKLITASKCIGVISGFGLVGYNYAIKKIIE